jgi:glycosyltransferase involved in cell wall biosynthesis
MGYPDTDAARGRETGLAIIARLVSLRVVSAILFSPRGGSAHVARALARGLRAQGCDLTLVAGSRDDLGRPGEARAFYGDVRPVDFSPALRAPDPIRFRGPPGTAPLHPSYEDKPGAPDRVFAALDDEAFEDQVGSWARELERAGAADADVLHLHHLTPLNEAAARVAPDVPVVGQLHGTELLMLEAIDDGTGAGWPYADAWAQRLRRWAAACERIVVSEGAVDRAGRVLGVEPERLVALPGGVETERFRPLRIDRDHVWRQILGAPLEGPVLLYVGRFTAVKRLGLLIEAFATAAARVQRPSALVLVGGHPGEWEGEHPAQIVARLGLENVHLAGWHPHDRLPELFSASDAVVLTSSREQFGLVLVEGMACGLPAVATASAGPSSIISDGQTGWLVPANDRHGLETALAEVLADDAERTRRGRAARDVVRARYSWTGISSRLLAVLEAVARPTAWARSHAQR